MKFAIDTNIMVYASGVNGAAKKQVVFDLMQTLPEANGFVPVQGLGELLNVLVKKAGWTYQQAQEEILFWQKAYGIIDTSIGIMNAASDLAARHRLPIWDSVIMAAAASVECDLLLSEDMQDGFNWKGVTVVNPFASSKNPLLQAVLKKYQSCS